MEVGPKETVEKPKSKPVKDTKIVADLDLEGSLDRLKDNERIELIMDAQDAEREQILSADGRTNQN